MAEPEIEITETGRAYLAGCDAQKRLMDEKIDKAIERDDPDELNRVLTFYG